MFRDQHYITTHCPLYPIANAQRPRVLSSFFISIILRPLEIDRFGKPSRSRWVSYESERCECVPSETVRHLYYLHIDHHRRRLASQLSWTCSAGAAARPCRNCH